MTAQQQHCKHKTKNKKQNIFLSKNNYITDYIPKTAFDRTQFQRDHSMFAPFAQKLWYQVIHSEVLLLG